MHPARQVSLGRSGGLLALVALAGLGCAAGPVA
jgi:hypothetical protein